jgi:hypothetical protein
VLKAPKAFHLVIQYLTQKFLHLSFDPLMHSSNYVYKPASTFNKSVFCPQQIYVSRTILKTAITSSNSIN